MSLLDLFRGPGSAKDSMVDEILERKRRSLEWLSQNYYPEWEQVYKSYKLFKEPYRDDKGEIDEDRYSASLPDTLITTRRGVARVTAQIPQIGYRSDDAEIARAVSRTLMWQWDKSQMQRIHKRNVLQAFMFGWSVVGFDWEIEEYRRRRRIQLFRELNPADREEIAKQYQVPVELVDNPAIQARLIAMHGRGGKSIPIERMYRAYMGPRPYFVFIGDCFPEPEFDSIQTSSWFIVERRRTRDQLDTMAKRFPEFRKGIAALYEKYPNGSSQTASFWSQSTSVKSLRARLRSIVEKSNGYTEPQRTDDAVWVLSFEHRPGKNARLRVIGEDSVPIGSMDYPVSLDGKIAFAETEVIPELLGGIGDSTPRLIRPLQKARNDSFERRMNLVSRIERPLVVTNDKRIYENPKLVAPGKGFRSIFSNTGNPLQYATDQAAAASVIASMGADSDVSRNIQMASGESNLTLMAGVDAQQARTATGSRLMQQNMDVLSRSDIRSVVDSGVASAVEIMFLMNASEMTDAVNFDPTKYDERWAYQNEGKWLEAQPYMFQGEGTLTIREGSTLADDDEASLTKAQTLWGIAMQRPDRINIDKAAEAVLEAMGERPRLQEWILPQQPPPPPEPPKKSVSMSFRSEDIPPEMRMQVLVQNGLVTPPPPPPQSGPMDPGMMPQPEGMPPDMPPGGPQDLPPEILQALLAGQ